MIVSYYMKVIHEISVFFPEMEIMDHALCYPLSDFLDILTPVPWVLCLYCWIFSAYSKEENITQILDRKGITTQNEDLNYLGEKEREIAMY